MSLIYLVEGRTLQAWARALPAFRSCTKYHALHARLQSPGIMERRGRLVPCLPREANMSNMLVNHHDIQDVLGVVPSEPMPRLLPTDYVHRHIHQAAVIEIRLPNLDEEDLYLVASPPAAPG